MTDRQKLNVVPLYDEAMAQDVVGSLRRAADTIARENADDDRTVTGLFVQVTEAGTVNVYAWGLIVDRFRAAGLFTAAIGEVLG